MKKLLFLLFVMILLSPIVASAHDIEVKNADGVTIYYNYSYNEELVVTSGSYSGNIVIPDEVTYKNVTRKVTSIGESAFRDCSGLISVTIPNNVTSIGRDAFSGCSGLTSVTINNNSIVSMPRRLSSVFGSQVTKYIIGEGVTSIGTWAFDGCSSLTSVTIPNSVTSIGEWAFSGCSSLNSVTIPNNVTSIGAGTFSSCSSLTSVTIPNSVTSIGRDAFQNCSGLTSVTIGNGVTSIGEWAFANCTALTSITMGNSVTSIEQNAFYECSGLQKVIVSDIAKWCGIKFDDHPLHYDGHLYSDENTEIKDLVIPNTVTSIGDYAFRNCTSLSSVTISNSVKSIGRWAFIFCSGLTSVTISNSVKSIGSQAFSYCSCLTSVTIGNSVTSIEQYAFYECSGLQKVIVSDIAKWCGIKFGDYTANPLYYAGHLYSDDNTEIKNLVIPNTVTSIGDNAFRSCSGLTSVTIGNSVNNIGDYAFISCSDLTSITIPNSVTTIGVAAFNDCKGLTSVIIGSDVTSIGNHAFDGADISTVISLIENPFTINGKTSSDRTFTFNTFNNATLYIPIGTIDKYKASEGWRDFVFIEEGNPTGINAVKKPQNNNTTIYNMNGVRLPEPKKGINIVYGKKVVMK